MKYRCYCNCHCTCSHKLDNEQHKTWEIHVLICAKYDRGSQSPCCDECKDLPENFTFEDLCRIAPPLRCLFEQAQEFKRLAGRKQVCGNAIWYSTMKPILIREVGDGAHHPVAKMNGGKAYDLAYKTISEQLPNCNHEGMCGSL